MSFDQTILSLSFKCYLLEKKDEKHHYGRAGRCLIVECRTV
jgi:hypothetical protein